MLVVATLLTITIACNKDVEGRTDNTTALKPSSIDLDAGAWKTVLLTAPDEFAVAAPSATTTPDYIAQVNEIKTWQADLTNDEKNIVKYWSAGAVLRWNEILRGLVAKHNLPPYQNADGTYPFPSAANPFKCKSMGLVPMLQPPGSEILNFPYLESIGPIIRNEARSLLTKSLDGSL